jgi:cobalt-zinc-cadmium efflux system protein
MHLGEPSASAGRRLGLALGVTLALVAVEAAAGVGGHSLALLADAGHNLTDALALGLSWYALRLAAQPANASKTFGYHRAGILAALANAAMLVVIALGIFYEAFVRLRAPLPVAANLLVGVGSLGLLINGGAAWLVHRGSAHDLNLRSAFVHLLGDVAATGGAVLAGLAIALTGQSWLDPAVSLLIGALILWSAGGLLRETLDILLESTPRDIDMTRMVRDLQQVNGVRGVHDLHVWSLSQSMRALSVHILTDDISLHAGAALQRELNAVIGERYGITHTTLQLECEGCEPDGLYCDLAEHEHDHKI